MVVLGIETSCDETAAAVYANGRVLSNIVASQYVHQHYGGVVPELASRAHVKLIGPVIREAVHRAGLSQGALEGIAVTYGPGLMGSLLVGLHVAKGMALALNIPWVGVNHMEGHLFSNLIESEGPEPPFLTLIVSGGHTELILVEQPGAYRKLGQTKDDAAGEAFDKVARILGLGYPGGPAIDALAPEGNPNYVRYPRAQLDGLDFSFSGLKTGVLYHFNRLSPQEREGHRADIAASFQAAVVEVLVEKTFRAAAAYGVRDIALAGGVACNRALRQSMKMRAEESERRLFIPPPRFCTDNAAMIARAGAFYLERGICSDFSLTPQPYLQW